MRTTRMWGTTNQSNLALTIGLCLLLVGGAVLPAAADDEAESATANLRLEDGVLSLRYSGREGLNELIARLNSSST